MAIAPNSRKRPIAHRIKLTRAGILAWADAHFRRTGAWPKVRSGPVIGAAGVSWLSVEQALRRGLPGLPGPSSLAQLLAECRGVWNRARLVPFTNEQILAWADGHFLRTGSWPTSGSGPVRDAPGETWQAVHKALQEGHRGLPGGCSLARLLARSGRRRNRRDLRRFDLAQILVWAEAHDRRTGCWPSRHSGAVAESPADTWKAIDAALHQGHRGLPGGNTLARAIRLHRNLQLNI